MQGVATVAILGLRYPDFSIEAGILDGIRIVTAMGGTAEEIVSVAEDADVIIAGSLPKLTGDVISRLPALRAVVRAGIGVDNIDLDAARDAGLLVVNVPDYGTEAVAQHTLAMALAAFRRLGEADRIVRSGQWGFADLRPIHVPAASVAGVVGYGRIGRRVAELLDAVGFGRVVVHDPYASPAELENLSLASLLDVSDLVCLHAPAPEDGSALIGADQLARMKPSSALVNTSRGVLIDDGALADALASGAPRVAALDVFTPEPPDLTPFEGVMDRVLLSPHMAWYTEESQTDLRRKSATEAKRFLDGVPAINPLVAPEEAP